METALDAGPLQRLLELPGATDVLVSGPRVWVDVGAGLREVRVDLGGEEAVRALAVRLAARAGRRLDAASPFVDARLSDGVRLHAVLPPIAPDGTCLSLRVLRPVAPALSSLVPSAALSDALRAVAVARLSFVVTGGTGSGKTTLLASLLSCADPVERVVLVEDACELRPALPHVVRLEARAANVEGAGGVGLGELVRQALRMRPDRLVVGEARGPELADLLLALNTGHEGGATTLHANSVRDLPARLVALGALAGLSAEAVAAQAVSAFQVVVAVRRSGAARWVEAVAVLAPDLSCSVALQGFPGGAAPVRGPGWERLVALLGERGVAL